MAVLSSTALTLADWAKRLDDNYKVATIVELLSQCNEIMTDMLWVQGNLPPGIRRRSALACRPPLGAC